MEEDKVGKKRIPALPAALGAALLAAALVYMGGVYYYQDHFLRGTVVDKVDVSGMTIEELVAQTEGYVLQVTQKKQDGSALEEELWGKDIDLSYASTGPLEDFLKSQDKLAWFLPQKTEHRTEGLISYDEEKLISRVKSLQGFEDGFFVKPEDARISEYDKESGFSIIPEVQGNELDLQKTTETVRAAVEGLEGQTDLYSAGCYKMPSVTSEDEGLHALLEKLQKYTGVTITYTFGDQKEVLDGESISTWLTVEGTDVALDRAQAESFVAALRKEHDTIFRPRKFKTTYGKEITVSSGDYGWWMNAEQETEELVQMIERGESGERTPVYFQTAASYGSPDYGTTYVEINLTAQHLYLYKDGRQVLESDFVSGNSSRGYDTPAGAYGVTYKQRNATLTGENYRTPVSYWMPFNLNIGMHDAGWRSSFGGNIYKTNGSHGCINLPPSIAKQIYETIEKGTPVICYYMPGTEPKERVMEKGAPSDEEAGVQAPPEGEGAAAPDAGEQGAMPDPAAPVPDPGAADPAAGQQALPQ